MRCAVDEKRTQTFQRVLGDELRRLRKNRGWTRSELVNRLGLDISPHTLATWELGTRHCAAICVWQLCELLEEPVDELYARVRKRLDGTRQRLQIDLRSAATTPFSQLGPLQRWARLQLRTDPDGSRSTAVFDPAALDRLAELCDLETVDFIDRLYRTGLIRAEPQLEPQLPAEQDASA